MIIRAFKDTSGLMQSNHHGSENRVNNQSSVTAIGTSRKRLDDAGSGANTAVAVVVPHPHPIPSNFGVSGLTVNRFTMLP